MKPIRKNILKYVFIITGLTAIIAITSSIYQSSKSDENQLEWMDGRIQADLEAFNEIRIEDLDKLEKSFLEKNLPFMRIKINNGTLSYITSDLHSIYLGRVEGNASYLKKIQNSYGLPDTDLIIVLDDGFDENELNNIHAPVFCISKLKSQKKTVVIPELFLFPEIYKQFSKVNKSASKFPWDRKIEMGYWRGSTTGGYYALENWMNHRRTKLVQFSENAPQILDCAFSRLVQSTPEVEIVMRNRGLFKDPSSPKSQIKYKYLIAVDGNTCASSLKWQVFSNSVVLKNDSEWMEWYDTALISYKHYIPFRSDFSDLVEKIEWLKQNDRIAQKVAKEAHVFAQQNFCPEGVELYVCKLLKTYSELLKP